jgi:hypothetical protein
VANFHARVWCGWTITFEYLAAFIKLVESNFAAGYGTGGSEQLQVQKHLFRACRSIYQKHEHLPRQARDKHKENLEPKRRHDV